jgi:hypothetical protein
MNTTIDTTPESSAWSRNVMQAVSLVCGLALAAVLAFGTPDWYAGPSKVGSPAAAALAWTPEYPRSGPVVVYIVASEADRVAVESSLIERSLVGVAEPSILVLEATGAQSPYDILADEIDPSVQIIDLTDGGRRIAQ